MTTIKAVDKLRKNLREWVGTDRWETLGTQAEFDALADEIEAEIAERFIALPVDEEGDVLRIGDKLKCQGKSILLNSLSWDGRKWYATETVISSGWYPVHLCRHVKPRTLEDVLADFVNSSVCVGCEDGISSEMRLYADGAAIARCAEEIRAMFGEVDDD